MHFFVFLRQCFSSHAPWSPYVPQNSLRMGQAGVKELGLRSPIPPFSTPKRTTSIVSFACRIYK